MAAPIGTIFRWRADALAISAGKMGVCYSRIDHQLAGILFETGVPTALSDAELCRYAHCLGLSPDLANYRFEGLTQLLDDFARGRFVHAFRSGVCNIRPLIVVAPAA